MMVVVITLSIIDYYTIKSSTDKTKKFLSYAGETYVNSIENLKRALPMVLVVAIAIMHTMTIVAFFILSIIINASILGR